MTYTIKDFTDLFERDRTNKQKNKKNKRTKIRKFSKNQTKKQIKKKKSAMCTYVVSKNKIKKEARDITAVSTSVVDYFFSQKKLTNVIN